MSKAIFAMTLTLSFLLVGPTRGETPSTLSFDFEAYDENSLPDGFQTGMTGTWQATEWSVRILDGNRVLGHFGFWDEDPEGVFPVCWVKGSKAQDLTLTVRLFPVHPPEEIPLAEHDGAGIVVRFEDPDNYYLLRAVPLERRVRFYKVENGQRSTLTGKNLEVSLDTWHELRLDAKGSTFTAYFDGEELFRYEDTTFPNAGAFGLWSKPNNVTYFDDLAAVIVK